MSLYLNAVLGYSLNRYVPIKILYGKHFQNMSLDLNKVLWIIYGQYYINMSLYLKVVLKTIFTKICPYISMLFWGIL